MTANHEPRRFSDNRFSNPLKGRSMMDFGSLAYEENESRYENWRKAKKFISAFSPKSQQDLNRSGRNSKKIKKSSSTSALRYDPAEEAAQNMLAGTSSMSELEDTPPSLNIAMLTQRSMIFREDKDPDATPNGLIRLKDEGRESTLKARGGVNMILARRLASGVNGSYSKYDGERNTHLYQADSKSKDDSSVSKLVLSESPLSVCDSAEHSDGDAIEHAISRERMKMKQSDRRASSISFQKNLNVHMPMLNDLYNKVVSTSPTSTAPTITKSSDHQNMLSSNESLSSEARSKISIKKRSNSPPVGVAPIITPRQTTSQRTLTLQKLSSSSIDSLNSHKTVQTPTSVKLPARIVINNSSSNETSSEESSDRNMHYANLTNNRVITETPIYHQSISRNSSRRMSEGQGSTSSDAITQTRKGYFRKNNKSRRSQRTLDDASSFQF